MFIRGQGVWTSVGDSLACNAHEGWHGLGAQCVTDRTGKHGPSMRGTSMFVLSMLHRAVRADPLLNAIYCRWGWGDRWQLD